MKDGGFQKIRHLQWRWFDFLWMTHHTMDYEGRDNFNTLILRIFSLLSLITVLSGFALAFVTSGRRRKKTIKVNLLIGLFFILQEKNHGQKTKKAKKESNQKPFVVRSSPLFC